jgi:hypothetical protein
LYQTLRNDENYLQDIFIPFAAEEEKEDSIDEEKPILLPSPTLTQLEQEVKSVTSLTKTDNLKDIKNDIENTNLSILEEKIRVLDSVEEFNF